MTTLRESMPLLSVSRLERAIDLEHYLLAPSDSIEPWQWKIVVVVPSLAEPTWVVKPRARQASRRSIMALAVPSLEDLTLDLAQAHTSLVSDYITLYEFPRESRRRGAIERGARVSVPWS